MRLGLQAEIKEREELLAELREARAEAKRLGEEIQSMRPVVEAAEVRRKAWRDYEDEARRSGRYGAPELRMAAEHANALFEEALDAFDRARQEEQGGG